MIDITAALLSQHFDCLILVHPYIQILDRMSREIEGQDVVCFNVSKELSTALLPISVSERCRFSQKWLIDSLTSFQSGPILCSNPNLLFDPSLELDPLALFRQAARVIQLIVLWPGEYSANNLSYAVPEHHHFRTWKVSDSLLQQPVVVIQRIPTS